MRVFCAGARARAPLHLHTQAHEHGTNTECWMQVEHDDPQQSVCNVKIVNKLTFRSAEADAVRKVRPGG